MPPPRRKGPALYELLGSRPVNKPGGGRVDVDEPHHDPEEEDSAFGIKPGRSIRVPMGYLFFAIAGVIALMVGGYMLGYSQRDRLAEQERMRYLTAGPGDPDDSNGQITDPLAGNRSGTRSGDPSGIRTVTPSGGSTPQPAPGGTSRPTAGTGSPLPNVWFVRDGVSDPRERGRNYFILATNYPWDEVEKAALFLGRNGVATVVYPSNRANRWNLSTREGFEGGAFRDAEAQALVNRIKSLGREYRSTERGATDFDDLYPARLN